MKYADLFNMLIIYFCLALIATVLAPLGRYQIAKTFVKYFITCRKSKATNLHFDKIVYSYDIFEDKFSEH